MNYESFLQNKEFKDIAEGFEPKKISEKLYPFQQAIVRWALKRGRAAIFADTGLGKTPMQLEWAKHVYDYISKSVLIFAPLCVAQQTVREGEKFGIEVKYIREQPTERGIYITNYEMLDHFRMNAFQGIVLDESSILKHQDAKTRTKLIEACRKIPFKLSCTATPSPNDYMELGNQAEFLGIMNLTEMLAMFFVHDGGETQKWRLKGHGEKKFWEWLSRWAVAIRKPSDIGFENEGYDLPELTFHHSNVKATKVLDGFLFPTIAQSLQERIKARRDTVNDRVYHAAGIVNSNKKESWLIWCNLNSESEKLTKEITGSTEVRGSQSVDEKEKRINGFIDRTNRILVTKPSIAGFGLNLQFCSKMIFVGLNDSYEEFYQAVRRCWRYGQTSPVDVYIVTADIEGAVLSNIQRKEKQAEHMMNQMVEHMRDFQTRNVTQLKQQKGIYMREKSEGTNWTAHLGDCVEVAGEMTDNSIDYSIFSPPFASLYTYSNSDRDMGNCKNHSEFYEHFQFLVKELFRITKPGREVSFHCMNLPTSKQNDGVIGLRDFRGELIRMFCEAGFVYHSEVCIWKDPVTAMQRTKAIGLLWKQIKKDSALCRQGIADYVVTMRKPGVNPNPITHTPEDFPVSLWQRYASPVWMDIDPSRTLNRSGARENEDERHIAPLQLDVIERCLMLWTRRGDLVFSPFMGIGSEGHVALKMERKFVGSELKASYFKLACKHLDLAEREGLGLFASVA